ncbi:MAG TPA: 30S ribosomal protein S12 methylthiotransferase RimO [Acidimicrobiales bacterium]|nr:30S ribosomal protein S12 methylthiotransferase RimO [Acidimicrobiales bacterium]
MATDARTYSIVTLGCAKNQVDSDKLAGKLEADGLDAVADPGDADLIVVNTCAFIEEARTESIDTVLGLDDVRRDGSRLVVTGCMAERYGDELAEALPEVDRVAGFGRELDPDHIPTTGSSGPVSLGIGRKPRPAGASVADFDLLNLPRPATARPWAYVKAAEGCDRACGFCAIPTFRGKQRSRPIDSVLAEIEALDVSEIVLIAQDLVSYGRDQGQGSLQLEELVRKAAERVAWVRLLYLYPSGLTDALIDAMLATGVAYFDLSLQHVSPPLLRRMRRPGSAEKFASRIDAIRALEPSSAFRSNFIVGYPGETEADHDALLDFVEWARLDWCGFFAYSPEDGTHAVGLDGQVPRGLVADRLAELRELQERITADARDDLVGTSTRVLVDRSGVARSHREAPEIDGIIHVPEALEVGAFCDVEIIGAAGTDLEAVPVRAGVGELIR